MRLSSSKLEVALGIEIQMEKIKKNLGYNAKRLNEMPAPLPSVESCQSILGSVDQNKS